MDSTLGQFTALLELEGKYTFRVDDFLGVWTKRGEIMQH